MRLEDKVVVVTGFGAGLGREIAVYLAGEGARVVGFSRDAERGAQTVALIDAAGGQASFASVDVRDSEQVAAGIASAVARFGGLDGVVNCAGARVIGTAEETSPDQWDLAIATNLTGTFLVSRAAVPELRRRGGGAIVNITTTSALRASTNRVAHGVSKAGVHMLTTSMARDHMGEGLRVNCVLPGPTAIPLTPADPRNLGRTAERMPGGRVGTAQDVGEAVVYLLSDAGQHVTGVLLPVDGGLHLTDGI
jgi:NAD(P)-dependent dehydrogenase (short-subunit alcohol dehydrogenase family)